MKRTGILLALLLSGNAMASTILTFNVTGISDLLTLNQNYGDRVSGPSDAVGSYGTTDGNYTPNVVANYVTGTTLYTTGYGNLTNVIYNAQETFDFSFTLTADSGYLVTLEALDVALFSFALSTITPNAVTVADGLGNVLFTLNSLTPTAATRNTITPNVTAEQLVLTIRSSVYNNVSDNLGVDNITFSQQVAPTNGVPEPGTWAMMAGALGGLVALRRRK